MTTQLQNQDPFAPVDNADFIAQMAQFSTVTGITSMDQTMKSVSQQLSEMKLHLQPIDGPFCFSSW